MDDDRKDKRTGPRPQGTGPAGRRDGPPKGKFGKPGFGKPTGKGGFGAKRGEGKPFGKPGGKPAGARPFRKGPEDAGGGARPRARSDDAAGARPFRSRSDGPGERPAGKPFRERPQVDRAERPAGERTFTERKFERPKRDGDAAPTDAKPFRKRTFDDKPGADRPPRQQDDGRPQYWGKRPGKHERQEISAKTSGEIAAAPREFKPKRLSDDNKFKARPDGGGFHKRGPTGGGSDRKPGFGQDRKPAFVKPFGQRRLAAHDATPEGASEGERIAKRLARAGISSRRDAEELIAAGRVRVNGHVLASPALNVSHTDKIELDGVEIPAIERTRLFLFHKPAGVVTTNRDPEGRRTVFDVLPDGLPRLMTIGRLDINTEGLLLLTNDGGLSRVLELPATGWLRRYRVRVHGKVEEQALADLKDGIAVDSVFYGAIEASLEREQGSNAWLMIGLREGKNREVKNVLGALGLEVTRLIRVSYGPFQLGELAEGQVLEIKGRMLRDQLGERLVEESGANFDADVTKPFSNKPVRRGERPQEDREQDRPARTPRQIGYEKPGGLIKNFRRDRDDKRENALGRLSTTRPERGGHGGPDGFKRGDGAGRTAKLVRPAKSDGPAAGDKPRFAKPRDKKEREERPIVAPGVRKANVWMAPGARPQGAASAKPRGSKSDAARAGKPSFRKSEARPDGPRGDGPRRDGPGGKKR